MGFYDWAVARERENCNNIIRGQVSLGCGKDVESTILRYGSNSRQYIRVFYPKNKSIHGYMVSIHGGGLIAGEIAQNTNFCTWLAAIHNMAVFSVEYRLMPEVAFNEQLEDICSAFNCIKESLGNYEKHPIYLIADSAGCHLALITNAFGNKDAELTKYFNVQFQHDLQFDGVWFNAPMLQTVGFNEIGIFMARHWYGKKWRKTPMAPYLRNPAILFEWLPNNVVIITSHGDKLKKQAVKAWKNLDSLDMRGFIGFGKKNHEHDWIVLNPTKDGLTRDLIHWAINSLQDKNSNIDCFGDIDD